MPVPPPRRRTSWPCRRLPVGLSGERLEPRWAPAIATLSLDTTFQTIEGYGTHLNLDSSLTDPALLSAYVDAGFNMVRLEVGPSLYTFQKSGDLTIPIPIEADLGANIARFDFERGGWAMLDDAIRWMRDNSMEPERFRLTGSVWSPPHWLKIPTGTQINWTNWDGSARSNYGPFLPYGVTGGNSGGGRVDPARYQEMARWVLSFVKGYSEFVGVPIDSFSFQNEPDYEGFYNTTSYGRRAVDPADPSKGYVNDWTIYADAFQAVVDELALHPEITTRMIGPEIMTVSPWANSNSDRVRAALADRGLLHHMDIIGAHGYEGVSESAIGWDTFWRRYGGDNKPIYMTEHSGEIQSWLDGVDAQGKSANGALSLALKIHNAFVYGHSSTFEHWSFSNSTEKSSLVQPANRATPEVDPKYAAMVQFSRFIRPGAVRIGASFENGWTAIGGNGPLDAHRSLNVGSYYHPVDRQLTTVLVNMRDTADTTTIVLPNTLDIRSLRAYRSTGADRVLELPVIAVVDGRAVVQVPPKSVITVAGINESGGDWQTGLPFGWDATDVGNPALAGATTVSDGTWTLRAAGADIWNAADEFQFAARDAWRDATVTARVDSVQNTNGWAKAGAMIRGSGAANAPFAAVFQLPSNEVVFQWRSEAGANATFNWERPGAGTGAKFVRVERVGDSFAGSFSLDGVSWTRLGDPVTVALPETALVGLAYTSHATGTLGTATFSDVTVSTVNAAPTIESVTATLSPDSTLVELAVVASDDYPASDLGYSWRLVEGPAPVIFSPAKPSARVATAGFAAGGEYLFEVTATDRGGESVSGRVRVSIARRPAEVVVVPANSVTSTRGGVNLEGTTRDQFGLPIAGNVTWTIVSGGGTINAAGQFTAGVTAGDTVIRANAGNRTAEATIAVLDPETPLVTLQFEEGTVGGGTQILSFHAGYRGAGFVDFPGNGGFAGFTAVDGGIGGRNLIWIRYALGATAARAGRLTVNGVSQNLVFPSTGSWTTWQLLSVPVTLRAGNTNDIRIESIGQDLANLDELRVGRLTNPGPVVETMHTPAGQMTIDGRSRTGTLAVEKTGGGSLVLTAAADFSGGIRVTEGRVIVQDIAGLGAGGLAVTGGSVSLEVGYGTVSLTALDLGTTGRIDIGTGGLRITAGGFDEAKVRQWIVTGRNGGSWDGATGIVSQAAAPGSARMIGYRIIDGAMFVSWAAAGDADLDGVVSIFDLTQVVGGGKYNADATASWSDGDFNYDGRVNLLDLVAINSTGLFNRGNYRLGTGTGASSSLTLTAAFALYAEESSSSKPTRRSL